MDTSIDALEKDLKRLLAYDAASDTYRHGELVFSAASMGEGALRWFELVVHVCELTEDNAIEAMASALGTNFYQMRLFPQTVFFGLKSDPSTLVLICRLPTATPSTQDILALLRQFDGEIQALKTALNAD